MADIIQLLPDSIANQIAAGEVIQRPSNVVKELLENSIDAGATSIQLIVKKSGKDLIQVIDNGCGMSVTDARMCFERHATSKIKKTEDLFCIRTMGFRGEAMASIAAIAHVELKTKRQQDAIGTRVIIEGSEVKTQEPVSIPDGTNIAVKNLFFNVPARRKFLKSDTVEFKHILEEFHRVALAHPDVAMELIHNNSTVFKLTSGNTRKRIVELFGKNYNEKLVPIQETTEIVTINGYIGKPETAKKTRGEQYLFVNGRFIKSAYLNHAVIAAYDELIATGTYPSFFIYLDIPPENIDINIHPTKTEVKFEDERAIYNILKAAAKMALGKHSITPSIDFETETTFDILPDHTRPVKIPTVSVNPDFNPFDSEKKSDRQKFSTGNKKTSTQHWESLLEIAKKETSENITETKPVFHDIAAEKTRTFFIHQQKYIVLSMPEGITHIHIPYALERIYFSQIIEALKYNQSLSQQELFPVNLHLNAQQTETIKELLPQLKQVGIDIEPFGNNTFVIKGLPAIHPIADPQEFIEEIIDNYEQSEENPSIRIVEKIAKLTSKGIARRKSKNITREEAGFIIEMLFDCENFHYSPAGKPTIYTFTTREIDKKFE